VTPKVPLWVELTAAAISALLVFVVAAPLGWLLFDWWDPWLLATAVVLGALWPDEITPPALYRRARRRLARRREEP